MIASALTTGCDPLHQLVHAAEILDGQLGTVRRQLVEAEHARRHGHGAAPVGMGAVDVVSFTRASALGSWPRLRRQHLTTDTKALHGQQVICQLSSAG